jgi:hypothetical protein
VRPILIAALLVAGCKDGPGGGGKPDDSEPPGDDTDPPAPVCLVPAIRALGSNEDAATISVPLAPRGDLGAGARFAGRAVVLEATGAGDVLVDVPSPLVAVGADGEPLIPIPAADAPPADDTATALRIAAADLPYTLHLNASAPGTATITLRAAEPANEGCLTASVSARVTPRTELAAGPTVEAPGVRYLETVGPNDKVGVAIDPSEHWDHIGQTFGVYVVAHREPEAWAADTTLVDVTGAVETDTLAEGATAASLLIAWDQPEPADAFAGAYDLVVDWGNDGKLDPGDRIDGLGRRPGFWSVPDLGRPGPYTAVRERRNDGVWLQQEIWYPEEIATLPQLAPLVVMSHGNGHNFRWYGHLGEHLASWGFVFMSHANNTQPGIQTAAVSTLDNTEHFVANHGGWWNGELNGRVDIHNIAWIGHSRGGEGVVRAYDRLYGGFQPGSFTVDDVRVVSSIAPTVFLGVRSTNPHEVPYHLMAGSADGDVTGGVDCEICMFLRIPYASNGDLSITYLQGASHNAFHTADDWDGVGPDRLSQDVVHRVQLPTYLALLGWYQLGIAAYKPLLTSNAFDQRPPGVPAEPVIASVWRDAPTARQRWIDAFQVESAADRNDLGGAVTWSAADVYEGDADDSDTSFDWSVNDPMNGMTVAHRDGFERAVVLTWREAASYTTAVPEAQGDFSDFDFLSIRAAQGTRHPATVEQGGPLSFAIELEDADGATSRISASAFGMITSPYLRSGLGAGDGWANEFGTVRVPLRAFAIDGATVDLTRIRLVRLLFGPDEGAPVGRLALDDLYLGRW